MAEPRCSNPYFWIPAPAAEEPLAAEKNRPPCHQPPLPPPAQPGVDRRSAPGGHSQRPDIALHARPTCSSVAGRILGDVNWNTEAKAAAKARELWEEWHQMRQMTEQPSRTHELSGVALASRTGNLPASEPSPPPDTVPPGNQARPRGPSTRGRRKIKAENGLSVVMPYPVLGLGMSCVPLNTRQGKTYRCKVCPLTFLSKSDMQLHSKSHTEAKAHRCAHCSQTFSSPAYLAQHLRIHLGLKPYRCSYCDKSFRQLSHLQQHTRIHTGHRPYQCLHPGCSKAFTQLSNLQSHQRHHNKDQPFKCAYCYRTYCDSSSLQGHLSAHAVKSARAHCCGTCGRAYTSENYLAKHMTKHPVGDRLALPQPRSDSPIAPRSDLCQRTS